jgi:two-component system, OmpR family, phosphate regulon sensor histidine kinase PhoR
MTSVRTKITFTYFLISVLIISVLGILFSLEIERYYFDRLLGNLHTETKVLSAILHEGSGGAMQRGEKQKEMNAIALASLMRITLIDSSGAVLYDSSVPDSLLHTLENHGQRPEIVEARKAGTGSNERTSRTISHDLLYLARQIDLVEGPPAVYPSLQFIRVSVELTDVNKIMYEIRFKIVLAAIVVLILVIIASQVIAQRLSNPIVEIGDMVKEIKAGNLDQKLPVRSQDEIGRLAALINEMTDRLKSDIEQMKKLERVRTEFLGNVSHELRTPIFSLKGFLETLIDGAIDDKSVNRAFVEKAYNHANRLDGLLTDLIEISRIETGEMKMSFRYFDVSSWLKQLAGDFADIAAKKKQKVVADVPDREILVLGDKDRLKQAVGNIVDNAIKYSSEGATTVVRLDEKEGNVCLSVVDMGPGIEPEHLPRIFERFYRVDKARSREVGGTGLGLAIVKHIIEAHGSKIVVTSEVGKGTSFSFELKK